MVDATQRHVLLLVPIVAVDMPRSTRPPLAGDRRWVRSSIPVHHNSRAYGEGMSMAPTVLGMLRFAERRRRATKSIRQKTEVGAWTSLVYAVHRVGFDLRVDDAASYEKAIAQI